ncbi:MAG: porin [Burkholderiaceae bacterium]|nr:porin [Burkholderiaceae bacterium]
MKKTLIALAAVAATGAAFAQSSVTLYGVADISVGDNNVAGSKFAASANGGGANAAGVGGVNNGNSRFGLRGTEDLGGGLKAGFNYEANVSLADGSACNLTTCAAGQAGLDTDLFQRAANVSLSGGFGSITAGRQLNTAFRSVAAWELTGAANYSAVAKQFSFAGKGSRNDAMISYVTPNFGGVTVELGTVLKGNNAAGALYDLAATYAAGPMVVSFNYNKLSATGAKANMAIGGKYNFGVATVAASYQNLESTKTATATAKKGVTLGVSAPVGPVILTADMARATDTSNKSTDYLLEAKYPLSKRTFVYGAYLNDATKGQATVKSWGLGVRHNF